jgi:outer membrane protein assembly factor BamE (lipoprotein component of BamABCDE complex)
MASDSRLPSLLRQFVMPLRAGMIAGIVFVGLGGCESKTMTHGHSIDEANLNAIRIGESTRIDLLASFGKPSFNGAFNSGKIYYVSQFMVEPAGGKKKTETRQIVAFTLDADDIVTAIDLIDETSGRTVLYLDEKTPTPGDNFGAMDQVFSNLKRRRND